MLDICKQLFYYFCNEPSIPWYTHKIIKNMKKQILSFVLLLSTLAATAQIAAVEVDKGTAANHVTDVVIVFKMHFDIGYTDWAEGILQKYTGDMLTETLKKIESSYSLPLEEQFVWTVPALPLRYIIRNCPAELKTSLNKALATGRITPHALPVTYQTEASDLETLVRGLSYSDEIRKQAGRELSRDAKQTDVPSHSHILPTLMANAGIDFLHIGCNPGSRSPEIPVLSFWEGADSKRILLMNWAEYYGSGVMPPKDWKHKTWLAMIHTHENTGAPTLEEVAAVLKEAKEKMPQARVKIGELKDFYDLLMAEKPNLPVVKGDMPDSWIHGYSSNPKATKLAREMHRTTYNTEALTTLLNNWGIKQTDHSTQFDAAIENQILYDEHTFGIAMTHGNQQDWAYEDRFQINKSLGYYDYAEASWKEKQSRIETAERIVKPILRNALRTLAANVATNEKRIVVYNSTPWTRSDRVKMFLGVYQKNFTVYALRDLTTGQTIPVYNDRNLISFDASAVPAMGYKTYQVITENTPLTDKSIHFSQTENTLENNFFKIVIDPTSGTLQSVYDKKKKAELVDQTSPYQFGGYVHEYFGQDALDRYNKAYVKKGAEGWANQEMGRPSVPNPTTLETRGKASKILYEPMPNGIRATVFGISAQGETQEYLISYTLYAAQPYLEITWGINAKKADARPEAGWLSFPFAVTNPHYKVLRLGGIIDPTKDFINYTNQYYYYINSSVALFDTNGSGVAVDAPESPGMSLDSTGLFKFGKNFTPQSSLVFTNLYNTQWGTNFTEWIEGSFNSTIRIRSYQNYTPSQALTTPSEESRVPLYAAYSDSQAGTLPLSQPGISVSQPGIYVTAFAPASNGTLLRLWEQTGKPAETEVTLPAGNEFKTAIRCNLRGIPLNSEPIQIKNNKFKIKLSGNEPATILLKNKTNP